MSPFPYWLRITSSWEFRPSVYLLSITINDFLNTFCDVVQTPHLRRLRMISIPGTGQAPKKVTPIFKSMSPLFGTATIRDKIVSPTISDNSAVWPEEVMESPKSAMNY